MIGPNISRNGDTLTRYTVPRSRGTYPTAATEVHPGRDLPLDSQDWNSCVRRNAATRSSGVVVKSTPLRLWRNGEGSNETNVKIVVSRSRSSSTSSRQKEDTDIDDVPEVAANAAQNNTQNAIPAPSESLTVTPPFFKETKQQKKAQEIVDEREAAPRRSRSAPARGSGRKDERDGFLRRSENIKLVDWKRSTALPVGAMEGRDVRLPSNPPSSAATAARRSSNLRSLFKPQLDDSSLLSRSGVMSELTRSSVGNQRARPVIVVSAASMCRRGTASPSSSPYTTCNEDAGETPPRRLGSRAPHLTGRTPITRTTTAHPSSVRKKREVSVETFREPGQGWTDSVPRDDYADDYNPRALSLDSTSTAPFEGAAGGRGIFDE